jgi:hypothetical protein
MRRSRGGGWIVVASCLISGCSSPVRPRAAGGDAPTDPAHAAAADNPFRDPRDAPSRDEVVARFFEQRGITLIATAESEWMPLDLPASLLVTIRNGGAKELRLIGERRHGVWPFRTVEQGRGTIHVAWTAASLRSGVQTSQDSLPIDELADVVVAPGGEQTLRYPILPPRDVDCARVVARATLYPLAVSVGDEPERVISLRLPEVRMSFGPPGVVAAAPADDVPLEQALATQPRQLIAAAVRRGDQDRAATVDRLVLALPGPDAVARRARCVALEWLTGEHLGDRVERWRSWWESDEGARFVQDCAAAESQRRQESR